MVATSSKTLGAVSESGDVISDLLADCYVFLLRQRYQRMAEAEQDGEQAEATAEGAAIGIPTVQRPSEN